MFKESLSHGEGSGIMFREIFGGGREPGVVPGQILLVTRRELQADLNPCGEGGAASLPVQTHEGGILPARRNNKQSFPADHIIALSAGSPSLLLIN